MLRNKLSGVWLARGRSLGWIGLLAIAAGLMFGNHVVTGWADARQASSADGLTQVAPLADQAGDLMRIIGVVQVLPDGNRSGLWLINGFILTVPPGTAIDERVAPLAVGAQVEVQARLQDDGSLKASRIRVLAAAPQLPYGPSAAAAAGSRANPEPPGYLAATLGRVALWWNIEQALTGGLDGLWRLNTYMALLNEPLSAYAPDGAALAGYQQLLGWLHAVPAAQPVAVSADVVHVVAAAREESARASQVEKAAPAAGNQAQAPASAPPAPASAQPPQAVVGAPAPVVPAAPLPTGPVPSSAQPGAGGSQQPGVMPPLMPALPAVNVPPAPAPAAGPQPAGAPPASGRGHGHGHGHGNGHGPAAGKAGKGGGPQAVAAGAAAGAAAQAPKPPAKEPNKGHAR